MTRPAAASALRADTGFTVFDLNRTAIAIDPADFLSMGRATPFAGWECTGPLPADSHGRGRAVWYDEDLAVEGRETAE